MARQPINVSTGYHENIGNIDANFEELYSNGGDTGYTGSQGPIGYTGSRGTEGYTGSVGFTGSQGTGFTGSRGTEGYTGSQGPIGYTGSQGNDGSIGYTGSAGISGSSEITVTTKTASHILELSDGNCYLRMDVASANDLTIPPNDDVAFPIGTMITVRQAGAGTTTFVAGSGVTILSPETLILRKQGSSGSLIKVDTNVWELTGDLEAVI